MSSIRLVIKALKAFRSLSFTMLASSSALLSTSEQKSKAEFVNFLP